MKILVIGATGGTGREIVGQAAAAGHEVTAFVRDAKEGREALPGVALIEGDARDAASLRRALSGQDAVADALGSSMSGPFKEVTLFSESTKALIEAMQAEGVRRLVCITGIGAGDSRGHGGFLYDHVVQPLLLRGVYADKDRQEELIRASGLDWVIVRPALLSDGPAVGGTQALTDLQHVHGGSITRADAAAFVLRQLASDEWLHKTPLIVQGGPSGTHADWRGKLPSPLDVSRNILDGRRVITRQAGEGHPWTWLDGEIRILALGHEVDDCYTAEVLGTVPGGGPAPHVQSREDEFFYVLEGGPLEFTAGNQTVQLGQGGFITIRSGTAHHFKNVGTAVRAICFNAPAGFDRFQIEGAAPWNAPGATRPPMPEVGKRLAALAPAYGIEIPPDPALFQRAPGIHVVQAEGPSAALGSVAVEVLAGPEHTGGRYAVVRANLAPGARMDQIGHAIASTGVYVLSGRVEVDAGGDGATLGEGAFMHLAGGIPASAAALSDDPASLLIWHAPGLAVPGSPPPGTR